MESVNYEDQSIIFTFPISLQRWVIEFYLMGSKEKSAVEPLLFLIKMVK